MARWRLREAHYIYAKQFGEDTQWEYKEVDRITGRERRKRFDVPLYCDSGSVVCFEGSQIDDRDLIFAGPPTPAMEPLDEEAKNINKQHEKDWIHPIDSLEGNFSAKDLLTSLQRQLAQSIATTPAPSAVPVEGVAKADFDALQAQVAQLMARNAELEAKPKATTARRA